jgi:aminoglycoside phosphotransferase (APT) family kinase protein
LLGSGGESKVYAMDADHVLRIYHDNVAWEYVEARQHFYTSLAQAQLPFALPEVYTVGAWVGHVYTVEKRMVGQDFSKVLPKLSGADRAKALTNFVDAAAVLGSVQFSERPYGELLLPDGVQSESWQACLRARIDRMVARADLAEDVPDFEQVLASIYAQFPLVGDKPPKSLVHGDYFPANVFVGDDLTITGIGDFSYAAWVGDARMDLAGAVWLVGAMPDDCADDSVFMRNYVGERWGSEILPIIDFYRLYYALFFSGCKRDDPATYWWCVRNLRGQ